MSENVLAVFVPGIDRTALQKILGRSQWTLYLAESFGEASKVLKAKPIRVVISERRLLDGNWFDLLRLMQEMDSRPLLIVADRLADESMWAEVLNLGGHDLLATPFDDKEVLYAVGMACRHRDNQEHDEQMTVLRQSKKGPAATSTASMTMCAAEGSDR